MHKNPYQDKLQSDNNNINPSTNDFELSSLKSDTEYVVPIPLQNYKKQFPNIKSYKFLGIQIYKIGNLLTFNFDSKTYIPKFSIGPHWYFALFLNIILILIGIKLYYLLFQFKSGMKIVIYIFLICLSLFMLDSATLLDPGIFINKNRKNTDKFFCYKCKNFFGENDKVKHCKICGVCIENASHHFLFIGKCVGKKNKISFYGMIFSLVVLCIYILIIR